MTNLNGQRQRWWGWRWGGWPVVLLTLIAGGLRFAWLGRPGIWADEGATYGRVNGSFFSLLEVLQFDGFAPLHYELYYALSRVSRMGPWMMRLWPAIAGTATVPAMYFLARQMVVRRTALWAAALACCSAYLLYYSRDAKMYAPLWLFVTLSMGCFLWWLRTGRREGWWLWVLCTIAAAGIHTPGLVVLGMVPVAFAMQPRKTWWRGAAMALGVAIIVAGPVAYYATFNRMAEQIDERGWNASMLQWVGPYNRGRELPELVRYTAGEYATGWEWSDKRFQRAVIDPRVLRGLQGFLVGLLAAMVAAAVPWRRMGGWGVRWWLRRRRGWGWLRRARECGNRFERRGMGPWGVVMLLSAWIVWPAYADYVKSFAVPAAPWEVWGWVVRGEGAGWRIGGVVAVLTGMGLSVRRWMDGVRAAAVMGVLFGGCCLAHWGIEFDRRHAVALVWRGWCPWVGVTVRHIVTPARMIWMPRYLGACLPAVFIGAAALLRRLPWGVRHLALVAILAVNLGNEGAKVWIDPEPPVERMVDEAWAEAHTPAGEVRRLVVMAGGFEAGFEPGTGSLVGAVGRYHISTHLDVPMDPKTFRQYGRSVEEFLHFRTTLRARDLLAELKRKPQVDEIVVWYKFVQDRAAPPEPLKGVLGKEWRLAESRRFPAYDHWTWEPLSEMWRFQYRREAAPATRASGTTR